MKQLIYFTFFLLITTATFAQGVPSKSENIQYVVTFGKNASPSWGDDDYSQIFFFSIANDVKDPIYLRVFDPDCGGKNDQINGKYNTQTSFTIYGGKGTFTDKDSKNVQPKGNYKSGVVIQSKTFGLDSTVDNQWYTFGPINPAEGEYVEVLDARVFKVIAEGISGDDGNLYRYFLSSSPNDNIKVEGGNAFTYEYTFRLKSNKGDVAYFYPFVDNNTVKIKQHNFDFDDDGTIKIYSSVKNGQKSTNSGDGSWSEGIHEVSKEEQGKSMNLRIIKAGNSENDMTLYITNEYNIPVPMFATPLGGMPKYKYHIKVNYKVR